MTKQAVELVRTIARILKVTPKPVIALIMHAEPHHISSLEKVAEEEHLLRILHMDNLLSHHDNIHRYHE